MERNNLKQIQNDWLLNYKIDKNGEIWSEHSKRFLKTKITNGYETISFRKKGKHITYSIHRLVALTFLPNPNEYEVVHHKNDNKLDNHVENLEWVTQKENVKRNKKKTSHPRKVQQLKNDIVIKTYDSVTEASKEIGLSRSAISKACLKVNKTAGGFVWNYLNNEHNHKELDLTKAKQIYDYENYYVFDNGCIYSKSRKKVLKPIKNASGYCYVTLSKNCIKKTTIFM